MAKVENFPLSALSEDEERIENIQKRLIQFLYLGIRSCQDDDIIKLCMNRAMRTEVIHKWKKYESKSPLLECSKLGLHRLVKLFHQHCHMDPTKFGLSADNPLHHAAKGGHLEVVKYLIEKANCNPNSIIPYTGACPLHCAARRGQLPVVNYLIHEANVDCSLTDINGFNAIHMAAQNGHFCLLKFLHRSGKFNLHCLDNNGISILEMAARNGYLDIMRYLIEEAEILDVSVSEDPFENQKIGRKMLVRSIIHVCDQGHTSLLAYIIQKLSEHQSIDTFLSYSEKYECLYKAVLNGHVKAVQKLHKAFISIDSKMASSIFRLAASKDQLDIIKYLIKNSANVNLLIPDSNGISALHLATLSLDIKTIKYLIERAKMPTYVRTNSGDSILHFAVKSKSAVSQRKYEVITYLVGIAPELIESLNNNGESVYNFLSSGLLEKNLSLYLRTLFDQTRSKLLSSTTNYVSPLDGSSSSILSSRDDPCLLQAAGESATSSSFTEEEIFRYIQVLHDNNVQSLSWDTHGIFEECQDIVCRTKNSSGLFFPSRRTEEVMRMFWELTSGSGEMSVVYNKLRKFSKADKTVVEKRKASDEIFTADSHKHTKIG